MPSPSSDRNLLLGLMAVQMGYVSVDQLYAGMQDWTRDKARSLARVLQDRGWLAEKRRSALEALVEADDDPAKSLAALPGIAAARARLSQIADHDVHASLDHLGPEPPAPAVDPHATMDCPIDGEPVASPLRFVICGEVGAGGLGKVYRAYDNELGREVALKEIHADNADRPRSRARFTREAQVTGRLEHPSIVPVYGFGRYPDGRLYYAMKLVGGESLDKVIRAHHATGTPTLRDLVGRLVDVANAIGYAHRQGVLHRDLKPGNIQAGAFGETIVLDWGLAKPMAGDDRDESGPAHLAADPKLTQAGDALGTLAYMSPEQAAGKIDELGPATDIYALGAILYEMLTASHPVGDPSVSYAQAILEGKLLTPGVVQPGVDAALESLCLKAMNFAPADRHHTAETFAADLTAWLAEERAAVIRSLFGGALDAYGTLVFQVQQRLANTPDTQQVRQDLLTSALAGLERLTQHAERTGDVARSVAVAHETMGDIALNLGQTESALEQMSRALPIFESLACDDPRSVLARRDVSVSLSKLGDVALRLGDAAGALGYFERSLELRESLARDDPRSALARRDVSVSLNKLGVVALRLGDAAGALGYCERSLAVAESLSRDDPRSAEAQTDLVVSCSRLGEVELVMGRPAKALGWFERGAAVLKRLNEEGRLAPEFAAWLPYFESKIAECRGGSS